MSLPNQLGSRRKRARKHQHSQDGADKSRSVRGTALGESLEARVMLTAAFNADQWYLDQINAAGVDGSIRGNGVVVGVLDSGVQFDHPDLKAAAWNNPNPNENQNEANKHGFDFFAVFPDVEAQFPDKVTPAWGTHGTNVAGIIASQGQASDLVGVATGAQVASLRIGFDTNVGFNAFSALSYELDEIDIFNNSWNVPVELVSVEGMLTAIKQGISLGRPDPLTGEALGSIYIFNAGNNAAQGERSSFSFDSNLRYVIAVGSSDSDGSASVFTEPGVNVLVSAPGGTRPDPNTPPNEEPDVNLQIGIVTTDPVGADGINTTTPKAPCAETPELDYTRCFTGTSAASPVVSGVVALMLEANPNLTWRDVQHVLVESANSSTIPDPDINQNIAGRVYDDYLGFGIVDAAKAVELAKSWQNVAPEVSVTLPNTTEVDLPDDATNIELAFEPADDLIVETVEVHLEIEHPSDNVEGAVSATLVHEYPDSETGVTFSLSDLAVSGIPIKTSEGIKWSFSSRRHWGEPSGGTWKIILSDLSADGIVNRVTNRSLTLHGTQRPPSDSLFGSADIQGVTTIVGNPNAPEHRLLADAIINDALPQDHSGWIVTVDAQTGEIDLPASKLPTFPGRDWSGDEVVDCHVGDACAVVFDNRNDDEPAQLVADLGDLTAYEPDSIELNFFYDPQDLDDGTERLAVELYHDGAWETIWFGSFEDDGDQVTQIEDWIDSGALQLDNLAQIQDWSDIRIRFSAPDSLDGKSDSGDQDEILLDNIRVTGNLSESPNETKQIFAESFEDGTFQRWGFVDDRWRITRVGTVSQPGELLVLARWRDDPTSTVSPDIAGDAIYSVLVDIGIVSPADASSAAPIHMIGHGQGAMVASRLAAQLATDNIELDHLTYLDPRTFGSGRDISQKPDPSHSPIAVWDNVIFADVYYQTRDSSFAPEDAHPRVGRPIPGAYNVHIDTTDFLPVAAYDDDNIQGDHRYLWEGFYLSSINEQTPATNEDELGTKDTPNALNTDYTGIGHAFSRLQSQAARPEPNYYDVGLDYTTSPESWVSPLGVPNHAALLGMRLTQDDLIGGRWSPSVSRNKIPNGSFNDSVEEDGVVSLAGWRSIDGAAFASTNVANGQVILSDSLTGIAQQTIWVPEMATEIVLDARVLVPSDTTEWTVELDGTALAPIGTPLNLSQQDLDFAGYRYRIPADLANAGRKLTLRLNSNSGNTDVQLLIDNVRIQSNQHLAKAGDVTQIDLFEPTEAPLDFLILSELEGDAGRILLDDDFNSNGRIYFVPDIAPAGQRVSPDDDNGIETDDDVMLVEFSVDQGEGPETFTARIQVVDGYSTSGLNAVSLSAPVDSFAPSDPLDVMRVQLRLRYFNFRGEDNTLVDVDGDAGPITREAIKLFQAATMSDGRGDPKSTNVFIDGVVDPNLRSNRWLNSPVAPFWSELRLPLQNPVDIGNETWATSWALEVIERAVALRPELLRVGPQETLGANALTEYPDASHASPNNKAGMTVVWELEQDQLLDADQGQELTQAEQAVIDDILAFHQAAGHQLVRVRVGANGNQYQRIRSELTEAGVPNVQPGANGAFAIHLVPPQGDQIVEPAVQDALVETFETIRDEIVFALLSQPNVLVELPLINRSIADSIDLSRAFDNAIRLPIADYLAVHSAPRIHDLIEVLNTSPMQFGNTSVAIEDLIFDVDTTQQPPLLRVGMTLDVTETRAVDLGGDLPLNQATGPQSVLEPRALLPFYHVHFRMPFEFSLPVQENPIAPESIRIHPGAAELHVHGENLTGFDARVGLLDVAVDGDPVVLDGQLRLEWNDLEEDGAISLAAAQNPFLSEKLATSVVAQSLEGHIPVAPQFCGINEASPLVTFELDDVFGDFDFESSITTNDAFDQLRIFENLSPMHVFGMIDQAARVLSSVGQGLDMPLDFGAQPADLPIDQLRQALPLFGSPLSTVFDAGRPLQRIVDGLTEETDLTFQTLNALLTEMKRLGGTSLEHVGLRCDPEHNTVLLDLRLSERFQNDVALELQGMLGPVQAPMGADATLVGDVDLDLTLGFDFTAVNVTVDDYLSTLLADANGGLGVRTHDGPDIEVMRPNVDIVISTAGNDSIIESLQNETIPDEVSQAFANAGHPLSEQATVFDDGRFGDTWRIVDDTRAYDLTFLIGDNEIVAFGTIFLIDLDPLGDDATIEDALNLVSTFTDDGADTVEWSPVVDPDTGFAIGITLTDSAHPTGSPRPFAIHAGKRFESTADGIQTFTSRAAGDLGIGGVDLDANGSVDGRLISDGLGDRFFFGDNSRLTLDGNLFASNIKMKTAVHGLGMAVEAGRIDVDFRSVVELQDPGQAEHDDQQLTLREMLINPLDAVVLVTENSIDGTGRLPIVAGTENLNVTLGIDGDHATTDIVDGPELQLDVTGTDVTAVLTESFEQELDGFQHFDANVACEALDQLATQLLSEQMPLLTTTLPMINQSLADLLGLEEYFLSSTATACPDLVALQTSLEALLPTLDSSVEPLGAIPAVYPELSSAQRTRLTELRDTVSSAMGQESLNDFASQLAGALNGLQGFAESLAPSPGRNQLVSFTNQATDLLPSFGSLESSIVDAFGLQDDQLTLDFIDLDPSPDTLERAALFEMTKVFNSSPNIPLDLAIDLGAIPVAFDGGGDVLVDLGATFNLKFGVNLAPGLDDAERLFLIADDGNGDGTFIDLSIGLDSPLTPSLTLGGFEAVSAGQGRVAFKEQVVVEPQLNNNTYENFNLPLGAEQIAFVEVDSQVRPSTDYTLTANQLTFQNDQPAPNANVRILYPGNADASLTIRTLDPSPDPQRIVSLNEFASDLLNAIDYETEGMAAISLTDLSIGGVLEPFDESDGIRAFADLSDLENRFFQYPTDVADTLDELELPGEDTCNLPLMVDAFGTLLDTLEAGLSSEILSRLPIIGDRLDFEGTAFEQIRGVLDETVNHFGSTDQFRTFLATTLGNAEGAGAQLNVLLTDGLAEVTDVAQIGSGPESGLVNWASLPEDGPVCGEFHLRLGGAMQIGTDFDLGLDAIAFQVETEGGVTLTLDYTIDVGFGVSKSEGAYLLLNEDGAAPEVELGVNVSLDDNTELNLDLFFLRLSASEREEPQDESPRSTGIDGNITIDIAAPAKLPLKQLTSQPFTERFDFAMALDVIVDLTLSAGIANPDVPSLSADLLVDWGFDVEFGADQPFRGDQLDVRFENFGIDLGEFVTDAIRPVVERIDEVLQPIDPLIEFLQFEIPLISQVAELLGQDPVTVLSLVGLFGDGADKAVQAIEIIVKLREIVASLAGTEGSYRIEFGDFDVPDEPNTFDLRDAETIIDTVQVSAENPQAFSNGEDFNDKIESDRNPNANEGGGFFANILSTLGEIGIEFPLLTAPASAFNILFGQPVDLVTYNLLGSGPEDRLQATFGWTQSFGPLIPPVPLYANLFAEFTLFADFEIGFDTFGFQTGNFLDGFFFRDEQPVLGMRAEFGAAAELSLGVFWGGVRGGVGAEIGAGWNDTNDDGKFRTSELIDRVKQGLVCVFELEGSMDAFLELYAGAGLDFFGKKIILFETMLELLRLTIFEFSVGCPPLPPPNLGHVTGDDHLVVNVGPNADKRQAGAEDGEDLVEITYEMFKNPDEDQESLQYVVHAFGESQGFKNIDRIVVHTGEMNDQVIVSDTITIPVEVHGGAGDDIIIVPVGDSNELFGGDGNDRITGGSAGNTIMGGDGDDILVGGDLIDIIHGNQGNDQIRGEADDDELFGDEGDDEIDGGLGADTINGGEGDDRLAGGEFNPDNEAIDGANTIFGGEGNDLLQGGDSDDTLDAGPGDDILHGYEGHDTLVAGPGNDLLSAGPGNDYLEGGDGDDQLQGSSGDDTYFFATVMGGVEHDVLEDADNLFDEQGQNLEIDTLDFSGLQADDGVQVILSGSGLARHQRREVRIRKPIRFENVIGGAGDDLIADNSNNNWFSGGLGDDTYFFGASTQTTNDVHIDTVVETDLEVGGSDTLDFSDLPNTDPLTADLSSDPLLPDPLVAQHTTRTVVTEGGDMRQHFENVTGGDADDTIYGNAARNRLIGNDGNDIILGFTNDDVIRGDGGTDSLEGGEGSDEIHGGDDADRIRGQQGNDIIFGGAGPDDIEGNENDDTIEGNSGNDEIQGGSGNDTIRGGGDQDVVFGDSGNDIIAGNGGNDTIFGGPGNDQIDGDAGEDRIFGQTGNDTIDGGPHRDYVLGDLGNDRISGGSGDDFLSGGQDSGQRITAPESFVLNEQEFGDVMFGDAGHDLVTGGHPAEGQGEEQTNLERLSAPLFFDMFSDVEFFPPNPLGFVEYIRAGVFSYTLVTGAERFEPINSGGDDNDDLLHGGFGNDLLIGDEGADNLYGDWGNDVLFGYRVGDVSALHEDRLEGGPDNDDPMCGTAGDNFMVGGTSPHNLEYILNDPGAPVASPTSGGYVFDSCFDEFPELLDYLPVEIHGQKFEDVNGDGLKGEDEPGLDGWMIELRDAEGVLLASTLTESRDLNDDGAIDPLTEAGLYSFFDLELGGNVEGMQAGIYQVSEVLLEGFGQTLPTPDGILPANIEVEIVGEEFTPGQITQTYLLSLDSGEQPEDVEIASNVDFGNAQLGRVRGTVWDDANVSRTADPDEAGLEGWKLTLAQPIGQGEFSIVGTAESDAEGNFEFQNLFPGTYVFGHPEPAEDGWLRTSPESFPFESFEVQYGQLVPDRSFGYTNTGTLSGEIWIDTNADGVRQPEEQDVHKSGLVSLDIDQDGQREAFINIGNANVSTIDIDFADFGTVSVELESDGDGGFQFSGLPRGIYTLWHTSTYFTSAPEANQGRHRVELSAGESNDEIDFGKFQFASVTGTVWHDSNNDGIIDNQETLLQGRTVFLDQNENGQIDDDERSSSTDAILNVGAGEFGITFLRPGEYNVVLDDVEGWLTTVPTAEESGFQGYRLVLESGDAVEFDFAQRQSNTISGIKWHDFNGNGVKDQDEPGLPNWTIFLDGFGEGEENGVLDLDQFGDPIEPVFVTRFDDPDTETDESGTYEFHHLSDGEYTVLEVEQDGWQVTYPLDPHVIVVEQEERSNVDFGNVKLSEIRGSKWNDVNGDGDRDVTDHLPGPLQGDVGLANWRVYLDLNQNGLLDDGEPTQLTMDDDPETPLDETGTYSFIVAPGLYHVREVPETGWIASVPRDESAYLQVVEIGAGETITDVDFANTEGATITGTKFADLNANGVREENEPPLADVVIFLDLNVNGMLDFEEGQPTEPVSFTDQNGNFQFPNLLPGFYSVAERPYLDYQQTQPDFLDAFRYVVFVEQGETADELTFGNTQRGDCNFDGSVDVQDALAFAAAFHSSIGDDPFEPQRYDVCFDFDLDDDIDFEDAYVFRSIWENPGPLPAQPPEKPSDPAEDDPSGPIPTPRDGHTSVTTEVADGSGARYFVPRDTVGNWQSTTFDDSRWSFGQTPLGYETPPGPIDAITNTNLARPMLGINSTVYVRIPFDVAATNRLESATLSLRYDDGFVAYLNGRSVASRNAPGRLIWNSASTEARTGDEVLTPETIAVDPALLVRGENLLAIQVLNASARDTDVLIAPEIELSFDNRDPVGSPECFSVPPGTTFVGTGLLDNDQDPDGDPLVSELVTPPAFGSLDLASDGSFTYLPGPDFPGSDQFSYVAVDPFGGRSEPITVTIGDCPGSIYGTKWHDLNGDGQRSANEPSLPSWEIFVDLNNNQVFDDGEPLTTTDANGIYSFELNAGTYIIREIQQDGWRQTFPTIAGTPLAGSHTVSVNAGDLIEGLDFGNVRLGQIHGTKWHDQNTNGERDPGEPGLPGWTIYLDLNNSGRLDAGEPSTITDANGNYWFVDLLPATYRVAEVLQPGWTQTFPTSSTPGLPPAHILRVQSGTVFEGINFGNHARGGEIHGTKYEDVNGNGLRDPRTGETTLRQWTIYLDLNDNGRWDENEPTTQTDGEGNFWFVGLEPGDYNVREIVGPGYFQTGPLISFAGAYPFGDESSVLQVASGTITDTVVHDMIVADQAGRLSHLKNVGTDYERSSLDESPQSVRNIELLAIDDDQLIDVVVQTSNSILAYRNQGDGSYSPSAQVASLMPTASKIRTGDVTGDGRVDLVFGQQQAVHVLSNNGDGTFTSRVIDVGAPVVDLVLTDLNNDGRQDAAAVFANSSTLAILLATSEPESPLLLTATHDTGIAGVVRIEATDLDQDGNHDLLVIPSLPNSSLGWIRNPGSAVELRFEATETIDVGAFESVEIADLNRDGYPDLALTHTNSNAVQIMLNDQSESFINAMDLEASQAITSVTVTEFDGDGNPDLVLGHASGFSVFRRGILDGFSVHLEPGQVVEGLEFGNFRGGRISGTKFWDVPCGGELEPEFAAEQSVTVYVDLNQNGTFDLFEPSAVTDENGNYSIFPVPSGTYPVREIVPEGFAQRFPDGEVHLVTISLSGQTVDGIDFTNFQHIPLPDGDDWLYGFAQSDMIYGDNLVSDECILSIGGDDHLFGLSGDDLLIGQLRNDTYYFDPAPEDGSEESDGILELVGRGTNQRTDEGIHDRLDFSRLQSDESVTIDVSDNPAPDFTSTEIARHQNALGGTHRVFVVQDEMRTNIEDLVGGQADDLLIANEFNNFLDGQSGSDLLQGQAGDDTYVFSIGNDTDQDQLIETVGNDTLDFSQLETEVTVDLSFPPTLLSAPIVAQFGQPLQSVTTMTPGLFENVIGSQAADLIRGSQANNIIQGTDGDDVIQVGGGNDLVGGGDGNDQYQFENDWGVDLLFELPTGGLDDVLDFSLVNVPLTWTVGEIIRVTDGFNLAAHLGLNIERLVGGSATNSLAGGDFDNLWIIDGQNSGTLNGIRFTNMTSLIGGAGNDTFVFLPGGRVDGDLDGQSGQDTFDFSSADPTSVLGTIRGGDGADVILGRHIDSTWTLTSLGTGNVDTLTDFAEIETLQGGNGNDNFVVDGGSLLGAIDGGEGMDELAYESNNPITFEVNADHGGVATDLGGFSSIESLWGGQNDDLFIVSDGRLEGRIDGRNGLDTLEYNDLPMSVEVTGPNSGTANRIEDGFSQIENLRGGIRPDTIRFTGGSLAGTIEGGLAQDAIFLDESLTHTIEITGTDSGTIDGSLGFSEVESIIGGNLDDTYLLNGGRLSGLIDGGEGLNELAVVDGAAAIFAVLSDRTGFVLAPDVTPFTRIDRLVGDDQNDLFLFVGGGSVNSVVGGLGDNQIIGPNANTSWTLTGSQTGFTSFVQSFEMIGSVVGGSALDELQAPSLANDWTIDGDGSGSITGQIAFTGFESLRGGTANDTFQVNGDVEYDGTIFAGSGEDTIILESGAVVVGGLDGGEDADSYILNTATDSTFVQTINDSGSTGDDQLTVVGTSSAEGYIVAPTFVAVNAYRIDFLDTLEVLQIDAGSGPDIVLVAPSASLQVHIDGGAPEPPSLFSDVLIVDAMELDVNENEGSVGVGEFQPVTHEGVELVLIANPPAQPARPAQLAAIRDRLFHSRGSIMGDEADKFWQGMSDFDDPLNEEDGGLNEDFFDDIEPIRRRRSRF